MPKTMRANVLVASTYAEADWVKKQYPLYRFHVVLTPEGTLSGFVVGEQVWTPGASNLPASVRLRLRGLLAPLIDENSVEEEFSEALLSW